MGSLSAINAIAGAFTEDSPVLVICSAPNLEDCNHNHVMHHTTGTPYFNHSAECFESLVEKTFVVRHLDGATRSIDESFRLCLSRRRPVYLEISCNLAAVEVPPPPPMQFSRSQGSDEVSLAAAVEETIVRIHESSSPVVLGGPGLRADRATTAFMELVEKLGCAVALQPSAKGAVDESHPQLIGCFWGPISSPVCEEIVESADLVLACGARFDDSSTVGWTALKKAHQSILVSSGSVDVCGAIFSDVNSSDFLTAVARLVPRKESSLHAYQRYQQPSFPPSPQDTDVAAPLARKHVLDAIQSLLSPGSCVVVETGDAWFIGNELKLPQNAAFHSQMQVKLLFFETNHKILQYDSIGWSVGAALGAGFACKENQHVILIVGDGAFQMTAQELSTMIRYGLNITIFLLNNKCYAIESILRDGPYNYLQSWNYADLVKVFGGSDRDGGHRVSTVGQLKNVMAKLTCHGGVQLVECNLAKDDCSPKMVAWATRVAIADMSVAFS